HPDGAARNLAGLVVTAIARRTNRGAARYRCMSKETLTALRKDAAHCTACPLYKHATQTVFGEGPARAKIVLVGEQPGDQEDIARSEEHTSELQSHSDLGC